MRSDLEAMCHRSAPAALLVIGSALITSCALTDEAGHDVNAQFAPDEHRFGIHAGDIETSMVLALTPEHVRMTAAQHFASTSQARAQQFDVGPEAAAGRAVAGLLGAAGHQRHSSSGK